LDRHPDLVDGFPIDLPSCKGSRIWSSTSLLPHYLQIGVMLVWLIVLFLVDYVLKYDFRQTQWLVISYVMLYFAGAGGMIGIASLAGRRWTISSIILFLIAAILAFVQRAVTGI